MSNIWTVCDSMSEIALLNPSLLQVQLPSGSYTMGGSQDWYHDSWQKMSGCGPTTAAGMLWYLARSRPELSELCHVGNADYDHFLTLMETMFQYITPTKLGVNSTGIFEDGISRYSGDVGVPIRTRSLNIPRTMRAHLIIDQVRQFLTEAFSADLPVAFLNLSHCSLKNLENLHWVMLISLKPATMTAVMCDQGRTRQINLDEWLRTTLLGGGFVCLEPK